MPELKIFEGANLVKCDASEEICLPVTLPDAQ
jgi:hypothetical protein